jgi:MoCo/4Fe-4S cofactor protein with predicted Tat translocation signal
MSMDQCHSTVGELPVTKPRVFPITQTGVTGKAYWRSLDELADTPDFRDWLEREFPSGASRLLDSSRRTFVKLMGASLALAGAATLPGCRRPDHKILPYSRNVPEEIIPGKPLYFASSMHLPGGAVEGVLVETHDGRPIKIEGNPLHPTNNGKSSHWAQASILGLYDPDRLKDPVLVPEGATTPRSWDDVRAWSRRHFAKFAASQGEGLAFLVDKKRGPSREAIKGLILSKYPSAKWVAYDPLQSDSGIDATRAAFGRPMREVLHLDKAAVVVSFDRDFLSDDPDRVRNMRGFSAARQVLDTKSAMSRIYMFESTFSITGSKADHRWAVAPSAMSAYAAALAREIASQKAGSMGGVGAALEALPAGAGLKIDAAAVREVARDLIAAGDGHALVVAGPTQPAAVHALCIAINSALGSIGKTVHYREMGADEAMSAGALASLTEAMHAGRIDTLVCVGVNPVYDAPGSYEFAKAFAKVPHRLTASIDNTETVDASTWRLPMAHALEAWGDSEAIDGTLAPIQPMIAPLYGALSDIEILLTIADAPAVDGFEFVKSVWTRRLGDGAEKKWRRALHDGVFSAAASPEQPKFDGANAAALVAAMKDRLPFNPREESVDVVFAVGMPADGRFANHGWLQELPDPLTKIVWDNVALVSPATTAHFGLEREKDTEKKRRARMITLTVAGQKMTLPAWEMPGIPDNTVVVQVGYGRTVCGLVGNGVGFNAFGLSGNGASAGNRRMAAGGQIERASEGPAWYKISTTQSHGSMEGRAIVREVDLPAWKKYGDDPFAGLDEVRKNKLLIDPYGQPRDLNFAERLGELTHTPANINAYPNPQRNSKDLTTPKASETDELGNRPDFAEGTLQWGMSIDLTTCTGCSACTIACQAENNIPIVGKIEVNKGREMSWIRVDRYFSGDNSGGVDPQGVMFQPVACVHCENAPCEVVCPVNATVHGPEGINYMVYNRCIGTRYCANNCPYKVRRFNFFQWGTKRYQGGYIGEESLEKVGLDGPENRNLIPARLREEINEIERLRQNPDVTVRARGVMEKCTYCIQRINEARIEMKLRNLKSIPDGSLQTACQQACPADAIVFGDIHDPKSRVSMLREHQRSYLLLGFLNTRPRTTYLAAIRNPNPALVSAERKAGWDHPFDHGHGGSEGHGDHHDDHGHGEPAKHSLLGYDPSRTFEDRGYRMSLAVLGGKA